MIDRKMALNWAGVRQPDAEWLARMDAVASRMESSLQPRAAWKVYPLDTSGETIRIVGPDIELPGQLARRMLGGCQSVILLCATLGEPFERQLRLESRRDMADALLYDAAGSAYVESFADAQEEQLQARFADQYLTDRFSCGYGDLPLFLQKELLAAAQQPNLGIYVSDSFMMNPTKSITALIGLADAPQPARIRGCAYCSLQKRCPYRKEGTTCAA